MIVHMLPLIIVLIMVVFLLPLLDVCLMMANGYLILLVRIMFILIEICLVLMNLYRIEVLIGWSIILLVMLAWALSRSGCFVTSPPLKKTVSRNQYHYRVSLSK
jgi:hypothetical protein